MSTSGFSTAAPLRPSATAGYVFAVGFGEDWGDMRLLLFAAMLALGLLSVVYAGGSCMMPAHVQSDLQAFAAKVAADDIPSDVLRYGSEKAGTDFQYLLDRVASLSDGWFSVMRLAQRGDLLGAGELSALRDRPA